MMKTSSRGVEFIKAEEGFRDCSYLCFGGKRTIGYGHVIQPGERLPCRAITKQEAEYLLKADILHAENAINTLVVVPLTQNQFDALISFVFNIGRGAFLRSETLKSLNAGNMLRFETEFLEWRMAAGKVSPILEKRRKNELKLFNLKG